MTRSTARRLLWIVVLTTLPVPFFLGEPELAPVLRLAFLTSLMGAVLVAEGGSTLAAFVGLGAAQTLGYGLLLWLSASLVAGVLEGFRTSAARSAVVAIIAIVLFAASFSEIYDTPLSSSRSRSSLFQIFE